MRRHRHLGILGAMAGATLLLAAGAQAVVPANINVTKQVSNQAEQTIAINPTNTANVVVVSNQQSVNNLARGYSFNSGATWTTSDIFVGAACCDPQATFDSFGNLFLVYINAATDQVNVAVSTDGGVTFGAPIIVATGSVDQPSVAAGPGSVWVSWEQGGNIGVRGASVTGLGVIFPFGALQSPPSATGSFGDIAVGPSGQVTVTYQDPTGGQGPATIYTNTDPDGFGGSAFGARVTVTTTNVGGFDFIPAQDGRSVDAEAGLAYDRTGGPAP